MYACGGIFFSLVIVWAWCIMLILCAKTALVNHISVFQQHEKRIVSLDICSSMEKLKKLKNHWSKARLWWTEFGTRDPRAREPRATVSYSPVFYLLLKCPFSFVENRAVILTFKTDCFSLELFQFYNRMCCTTRMFNALLFTQFLIEHAVFYLCICSAIEIALQSIWVCLLDRAHVVTSLWMSHLRLFDLQSTAVSCQEPSFVGGQRYDCPYSVPTSAESVDVSKETLVSFWTAGPLDNTVCLHEPSQHGKSVQMNFCVQQYAGSAVWA